MVKNRVGCTIWGMVLVGGLSVLLALLSAGTKPPTPLTAAGTSPTTSANATATTAAQATISTQATATTSQATATAQATFAPTSAPTVPVSTQPPIGQHVEFQGTIASVNQDDQSFELKRSGTTTTIKVNAGTQYSGSAKSFDQLQVGWSAEIHGVRIGGAVVATEVNANP